MTDISVAIVAFNNEKDVRNAVCSIIEHTAKYGFTPPGKYTHIKELVKPVIGYGSKMGEGWLLTAEMLELAETGYENIVCTQPFGCLPNHINGKGAIRKIKEIV